VRSLRLIDWLALGFLVVAGVAAVLTRGAMVRDWLNP
jgi:hypothetical protein